MKRRFQSLAVLLLAAGTAGAAPISTTLTVNATASFTGTTITATGTASLTGIGSGQFTATLSLTAITATGLDAPFTITLSGGGGTLSGTLTIPTSLISGTTTSATGSATITGGTGSYSGATGSFPSLAGSGGLSGTTITLNFTGAGTITPGGGGTTTATPIITQVASAADYSTSIAEGSLFIVKGSNLGGASGLVSAGFPLPTSLGNVTITFTPLLGGAGTPAYFVYTYNQSGVNQLAAILPSSLAPGTYNVTVSNNGAVSAGFPATVVQRHVALFAQDTSGTGLAVVQNYVSATEYDVNRFTTGTISGVPISPAHPGQALIAWGTGLGPITTGDNTGAPALDFNANGVSVQVVVGGTSITPAYAGRAPGLASEDQIVFTLPSNIATGCTVPLQISVNGTLSAATFITIAPSASATACVSPIFSQSQLAAFDNGATQTTAGFSLIQIGETVTISGTTANVKSTEIAGGFTTYTGFQLSALTASNPFIFTQGSCTVIQATGSNGQLATGMGAALDAGVVTLNGPSGSNISNQQLSELDNAYFQVLGETGLPTSIPGVGNGQLVAGQYTLAGAGGKDVGKFNATLTLGTPLTVTGGLPATVNRSAGLPLAWTGGNSSDLVYISGYAGTTTGTGTTAVTNATEFICITTAGQGSFTVPSSILSQLPAVSASAISGGTGSSFLVVESTSNGSNTFTASLTAGGTVNGGFLALIGVADSPVYQ